MPNIYLTVSPSSTEDGNAGGFVGLLKLLISSSVLHIKNYGYKNCTHDNNHKRTKAHQYHRHKYVPHNFP